ncbi:helix-turn-helix domain-containing protein [Ramlibacter sp. H39-3-26]|uniref:GlxA family transcriptional regulator n=1 Tax=Curvibacter soli TaxID=3031331 RepID=UPI0023DBE051|nr:helix-turn-helix domain-containing protein [Ramlibacter sp. H39-3-26]MDF1485417.1 helix-turn-helix domain-containing protein [Ramlibacter sp. H39-3-26]
MPVTAGGAAAPSHGAIRVVFVLLDGSLVLDWAGPAEALRIANQHLRAMGQAERFAIEFAGPAPQSTGSLGIALAGLAPLPALDAAHAPPAWVVLVGLPGQTIDVGGAQAQALLAWLRGLRLARGRVELVAVCAGALLAAHAGLLAGRRATTHHEHLDELQQAEPRCDVVANRVFVADPPVYSSAGVTAGIDLMLHRIAETCGDALAARVAQTMVVALRRGPHDPALSPFLAHRDHLHAALHRVQDAVSARPQDDWTVPRMAALAATSPRNLARIFAEHAGIAPLLWLRGLRLAMAQAALAAGANVTQAALGAGFASDTQLRRAWRQFGLAGSPGGGRRAD